MAFKLPRFERSIEIIEENRTPSYTFHRWWDVVVKALEEAISSLQTAVVNIQAAISAAASAQASANAAQASANAAQASAAQVNNLTNVAGSGTDVNPLSSNDAGTSATIVVSNHNRLYPNSGPVAVTGGSLTGLAYSTVYWIYYDDPNRVGGAVVYSATTSETVASQRGDRHLVGKITTPVASGSSTTGEYKKYPGLVVER